MHNFRNRVQLAVVDDRTGKTTHLDVSWADAQRLYKALGEIFGDIQFGAKPAEMIIPESVKFEIPGAAR